MGIIVAASNFVAAIFIVVIIIGLYISVNKPTVKTKYYLACLWIVLVGLLANGSSYAVDGLSNALVIAWISNYIAFVAIDVLILVYTLYLRFLVKEKVTSLTNWFLIYIIVLCSIDFILINIGTFTGKLFYFEDGIMKDGPMRGFASIIPAICLLSILVMLFLRRKKIGTRTCLTLSAYLMIAFVVAGIEIINPDLDFSWTATAISMLIIYIMVQSNIIADNRLRAEIYNDLSTKDVLTGLKNRRGYEEILIDVWLALYFVILIH